MTGDGAVVRKWEWHEPHSNPQYVQHIEAAGKQLWGPAAVSEHNAAIRQQAAEIERLTDRALTAEANYAAAVAACNSRAASDIASEARAADLLKALRECHTQLFHLFSMVEGEVPSLLEDHHSYPKIREALELGDAAIAAKGETV